MRRFALKIASRFRIDPFIKVLDRRSRSRFLLIAIAQSCLNILDLVGVALIGVLSALAISGVKSKHQGNRVAFVLNHLGIGERSLQFQATTVGLLASTLLISRTLLSLYFTKKTLYFLSGQGARISQNIISRLLVQPLSTIQKKSTQEIAYALTSGVEAITIRTLANFSFIIADLSLLIILMSALLFVDPGVAIGSLIFFLILGYSLYRYMNVRARELGRLNSNLEIKSSELIIESLTAYRESVVRNTRLNYVNRFGLIRKNLGQSLAELTMMPNLSKYVLEGAVVIGSVLIGVTQFITQDAVHAVATIAIFMAAGSRIAPAVLRVQQNLVQITGSYGAADTAFNLLEILKIGKNTKLVSTSFSDTHLGFNPSVKVKNVTMRYENSSKPAIQDVSLTIEPGSAVAVVGPSGAGKTSLVDLILGVSEPEFGVIELSGLSPLAAICDHPGAIAYVPQDILVTNSTIRENVSLGFEVNQISDAVIWNALELAHLAEFVRDLPEGLDSAVGERGNRISGGQRQRLGIARALVTNPRLIILDEATSSLDSKTESSISETLATLHGKVTVILVAHRLSTIKSMDKVIYLDKGRLIASGSIEEVRLKVPDFDLQANLIGL